MKTIYNIVCAGLLLTGFASCSDELNISSIDPQSSGSFEDMQLLAKQYAVLGLTGQQGAAGKGDMKGDEGETGFYRTTFNLQELCSDELLWAWQNDVDIPAITNIGWTSSSQRTDWAYQRLAYDVMLNNQFLTMNEGKADGEWPHYLAEVRFIRALHYWYFLDLFHRAPFKDKFNTELPVDKSGKDLYEWLDKELTDIEPNLAPIGSFNDMNNFGRADQGAAYALHARLALNSEVYTDGAVKDYQKAIEYCDKVINSGKYDLCRVPKNGYTGYEQLFMADNDENDASRKEMIFAIRQDGAHTRQWGGAQYLVASIRKAGMPYVAINDAWSCNFARLALLKQWFADPEKDIRIPSEQSAGAYVTSCGVAVDKLSEEQVIEGDRQFGGSTEEIRRLAGDDRALFYGGMGGGYRKFTNKTISGFNDGLSITKWNGKRSDGAVTHDVQFADNDIPLFRLAEMYLTRAEATFRNGGSVNKQLADINELRARANAAPVEKVDEQLLIGEWSREFYMEGRRRSDLVRFGMFTGNKYIWDFKGGVAVGTSVDKHYDVYPIPANEISLNPNMKQNPQY